MSQAVNSTIDERIVEMKFDNKQFESGVKQTMSTLDRLKAALRFNTDTRGIEKIQNTFNNFNLTNAMGAVDAFSQKLSALQIFGKRIVENLADDFYGAIKKVEQGIRGVFQQISTGGANRALNIEQAKFQLEGLHIAWEDIKGDIDYAVSGTAYGLDAAARVAAQLSASQVQVGDDMKAALRGISGVAAMTNSSYEEIGRIFSQVAGAGRLYTQDMLQMSSRGLNIAAALGQQLGHTEAEIREMVTKGQIDFKTFATAMNEAFGEQATKANDTYTGSLSNVKAALSRIGADIKAGHFETFRQVFVDLIPKLNEFKKAFKPVENVIIEVEAAVGKLLQKIISMVDVTKIVDRIAKPVEKVGRKILDVVDVVTAALEEVSKPIKTVTNLGKEAFFSSEKMGFLENKANDVKEALSSAGTETSKFSDELQAAKDIWMSGKYGNGQERADALTAAGIDPKKTQAIIEEFIKNGYDWDAAVKKVSEDAANGIDENSERAEKLKKHVQTLAQIFRNVKRTISAVATSVGNVLKALFKSVTGSMEELGVGDILINITGKIADLAEKFMITEEKADKLTKPVKFLLDIFKTIIKTGAKVVKTIASIAIGIGKIIYSLAESIVTNSTVKAFAANFVRSIENVGKSIANFVKTAKNSEGVKKFVSVIKTIGSTLLGGVAVALDKVIGLLSSAIDKLAGFLGLLADIFTGFFNGFKFVGGGIVGFLKSIYDNLEIEFFAEQFKEAFKYFKDPTNAEEVGDNIFVSMFGFIKHALEWLLGKIKELQLNDILAALKDVISISAILASMKALKSLQKMMAQFGNLAKGVNDLLASTAKVNKSIALLNKAKAFGQIAKVILAFAASVALLLFAMTRAAKYISESDTNAAAFDKAMDAVTTIIGKLGIAILAIIAALKISDLAISMFTSKTKLHVPLLLQFAAFMFSIGYAVKMILNALITLNAEYDEEGNKIDYSLGAKRLGKIALAIGGFFAGLSLIMGVINRLLGGGGEQATKGLYAMSLIVLSLAVAIDALMLAVSWMGMMIMGYGEDVVNKAVKRVDKMIWTVMGTLSLLTGAIALVNKYGGNSEDLSKSFAAIAGIFLAVGVSMIGIMVAVNDLTLSMKLFPEETIASFFMVWFFVETVLAAMVAMASQIKGTNEYSAKAFGTFAKMLNSLLLIIIAVGVIAKLCVNNELDAAAIGIIFIGLMGIIGSMVRILEIVGKKKPKPGALGALAGVFASLAAILVPLIFFRNIKPADMGAITTAMAGLVGIAALMGQTVKELSGVNPPKPGTLGALAGVFASLGAILVPLIFFTKINENGMYAIVGAMSALALIAATMSYTMKELSTANQPKPGVLGTLAGVFASLSTILIPLIFFTNKNEWDAAAIAIAMAGLAGIVAAMALVMKVLGTVTTPIGPATLGTLAGVFASLTLILLPIMALEGEDWPAILSALGSLSVLVMVMGGIMAALSKVTAGAQIFSIGLAFGVMSVGLTALGTAIALSTKDANIEGIMALTVALTSLVGVMTIAGAVLGKIPEAQMAILTIVAALFALSIQTIAVTAAINGLMEAFPNFIQNVKEFAYTLGSIPRLIKEGFLGETENELECHSPSKAFERIGVYCMEGLFIGAKDGLVAGTKKFVEWLDTYILQPVLKFFGIASPSKLFTEIGGFLGEGLINGFGDTINKKIDGSIILTGIKNKLNGGEFFSIGSIIGDDTGNGILSGITGALGGGDLSSALNLDSIGDKLNFDNLGKGLDINNLINTDSMGELDLTGMSAAITQSTEEGIRGVNYADIFTAEDLIDNEELYNEIKNAGQSGLVDAADEVKRHRTFMEMYPTFQDFLNDIDNNVAPELAKAYHEGNAEVKSTIEAGLMQNYIDQSKLSADAYKYTKEAQIKALKDAEIEVKKERESSDIYGPKTYEQTLDLKVNTLINGYTGKNVLGNLEKVFGNGNVLDGSVTFNVNEGQLKSNLTAVSTDISSSVNGLASTLKTELESIKSRIDTFDNNQTGRTNTLASKMGEVGNSMNNLDVMLDTGALVGQLIGPIDNRLGEEARRKARG